MAARTEFAPVHLIRWLAPPAALGALGALFMTLLSAMRRRASQPSLPRMSDEWMRSYNAGDRNLWP